VVGFAFSFLAVLNGKGFVEAVEFHNKLFLSRKPALFARSIHVRFEYFYILS
jgi:hypothetical protein